MRDHLYEQVLALRQGHSVAQQAHMDRFLGKFQGKALSSGLGQIAQNAQTKS